MKTKNLFNEFLPVAIFGICSWGCTLTSNSQGSGGSTDSGGSTGAGGITTSGGVTGKGGQTSSSGSGGVSAGGSGGGTDAGGSTSAGGVTSVTGKGGQTSSGGVTGQGGQAGSGGVTGSGGVSSAGGRSASGGATGPGDAAASGGATSTGGATGAGGSTTLKGPCDIYQEKDGKPCVAAHSTVRLLLSTYTGPLYQVRAGGSNAGTGGTTTDIGFLADGVANGAAQDTACGTGACTISIIYDQSGKGNHLTHTLSGGGAKAGADLEADAKARSITLNGHKVYGEDGKANVGYRNNKVSGTAKGDDAETMYAIFDATVYNSQCCFDYGNMETNTKDNGEGTMEAIYWGNCTYWGKGAGSGPWVMGDLENGLWAGNVSPYSGNTSITGMKYVTAILKGDAAGKNHWAIKTGNAQTGNLTKMFDGVRPNSSYNPMRKEGAIGLNTGGDNSNSAIGVFFEGIMTAHYSSDAADDAVQANIVAAGYGQ